MRPIKQPANLQSLALNASVKQFVAVCSNVDKTCSENVNCPHQASHKPSAFCRQCCQIDAVQKAICDNVAPKLWDKVVDSVESYAIDNPESLRLKDYQVFYALLIHPKMRNFQSKLLANNNAPNYATHSDNPIDTRSLGDIPCTDFWLEQIPSFRHVRTLDLTFLRYEATEILRLVGNICTELEDIGFCTDNPQKFELLAPCTKLRSIKHEVWQVPKYARDVGGCFLFKPSTRHNVCKLALEHFPNLEVLNHGWSNCEMCDTISSLDPSTQLNLRHLHMEHCTLDSFRRIATICPRLDSLDFNVDTAHNCSNIMAFLSTSPLVITKLTIAAPSDFSVNMENPAILEYFRTKGHYLQKLTLRYAFNHRTLWTIARYCDNLVELTIDRHFAYYTEFALEDEPQPVLTKLRKISFTLSMPGGTQELSTTLAALLSSDSCLSELNIKVISNNHEADLQPLGDCSWFGNLSRLTVRGGPVAGEVLQHYYERGENLIELRIHRWDRTLAIVESINKEAKENNFQFNIVFVK